MEHKQEHLSQSAGHSAGDAAPGLFAPDLLLASQQGGPGIADSPSRRLVGAVLERALLDAVGPTGRGAERDDALAWFRSDDNAPFSLLWIAHHLGIDADWLRSRVEARQPPAVAPLAPAAAPADGRRAA